MKFNIGAVARMANLSIDVIRSWERRYKIVDPVRDASGARMYSEEDVARLTLARTATQMGHPIRRVAGMSNADLEKIVEKQLASIGPYGDVVERILQALHDHDAAFAEQIVSSAALLVPIRTLVIEVVAPVLRAVGEEWEHGRITIWQEHLLSTLIRNTAGVLPRFGANGDVVLFATPPFERHEFGIALAALLAASRGLHAVNLGTEVPVEELIRAAKGMRAAIIVIGMTRQGDHFKAAIEYVERATQDVPAGTQIWLGGPMGERVALEMNGAARAVLTFEEFDRLCTAGVR